MAEKKVKEKAGAFGVSGWRAEELERLQVMVEKAGVDRSKFIRGLVRRAWETLPKAERELLEKMKKAGV
jgi:hypothetical protein